MVIVTALNDADKKHEALANGAEAYVLKPDLFEQLPQLLQTRSMGTAAPPLRSSLRSWDVITRWRTRPSSD